MVLRGDVERCAAVRRFEHHVTLARQHLARDRAHRRRVFHHEHGFGPAGQVGGRRARPSALGGRVHLRQVDLEGRAAPRLGVHPNEAPRLLHDPVHGGEAEPRALARLLGGEERLEDPRLCRLVHADAGVAHGEHHELADWGGRTLPGVVRVVRHVGGLDRKLAPRGHGVARVHRQVHEHLLELPDVGPHRAHAGVEHRDQVHILPDDAPQHLLDARDHGAQVHDPGRDHLLPAEGEQLAGERRGPVRRFAHLLDVLPLRIVPAQVLEQQVAVARDHREQVVEVVRDAASQSAHRLHLLRLHQLLLQPSLLRDVAHERLIILDLAIGIAYRPHAELHGQGATVLALPGRLDFVVFVIGIGIPLQQAPALRRVGVHVARHVEPQQLRGGVVAEHADQGGIHRQEPALRARAIDPDGRMLDQGLVARLGGAQRRAPFRLAQLALDRGEEALELPFSHPIVRARLHGGHSHLFADRAGNTDERDVEATLAHQRQRREPAEMRHAVVADHEIPTLAIERGRHGGGARDSLMNGLVSAALQLADEQQRVVLGVFGNQHS